MSQKQEPGGEKETGRLESFSDGVFAVAITLLVVGSTRGCEDGLPIAGAGTGPTWTMAIVPHVCDQFRNHLDYMGQSSYHLQVDPADRYSLPVHQWLPAAVGYHRALSNCTGRAISHYSCGKDGLRCLRRSLRVDQYCVQCALVVGFLPAEVAQSVCFTSASA